jgi:hypothetical protein
MLHRKHTPLVTETNLLILRRKLIAVYFLNRTNTQLLCDQNSEWCIQ